MDNIFGNPQYVRVEREQRVGLVQLHRPEALNALNGDLMRELIQVLELLDADPTIGCMVLSGGEKAFAAGADIKQMAQASAIEMLSQDDLAVWDRIRLIKKPIVAAVNGFALGGGCEVAMMCDLIIAGENAKFGQPEINIGVIPGAGGTQRLTRAVGKAKAMELILTGRPFKAAEALELGLINKVVADDQVMTEAKAMAHTIAEKPAVAVQLAKKAILKAFETTLEEGLDYERKLFYLNFATADQKEGMQAFQEKRPPVWKHT
ncbi:enoyl-CoA hydratase-related protein [Vampirovibrio chlorellavorus]|uniref:enoyl-CoA hydratase-related protein n=1 Tax=Vampirovibrio chlorellavorus TaxID=758823 RepID=UPI0026F01123|nr:enoyl-CoA hydratase-related protein [Vampirovibrio chlorellavorus]